MRAIHVAALGPQGDSSAVVQGGYLTDRTGWNHLRTISSRAASALFTLAQR